MIIVIIFSDHAPNNVIIIILIIIISTTSVHHHHKCYIFQSNLDMFEVLLDYNADLSVGLENTGGNLLHSLNYFDIKSRGPAAAKMFKMVS